MSSPSSLGNLSSPTTRTSPPSTPTQLVPLVANLSLGDAAVSPGPTSPTTPRRPPRSLLRVKSSQSLVPTEPSGLDLSTEVGGLLDKIFEIQELRHSHAPAGPSDTHITSLLATLEGSIASLAPRVSAARTSEGDSVPGADELGLEWDRVVAQHAMLKEEMKEDGWLVRFRTTADQAEAMMNTLQKSVEDCMAYVDRISNSANPVAFMNDLEDGPSVQGLHALAKGHEAMKATYVPSVSKILKMMDKSIADRPTKNGESLRRFDDMSQRWTALQRKLQQVDARVRLFVSQYDQAAASPGDVEVLSDTAPYDQGDYFTVPKSTGKWTSSHGSSLSSASSISLASSNLSPPASTPNGTIRKRASMLSTASAATATARTPSDKPIWNISTKVSYPTEASTPTNRRISSYGRPRAASPTPSSMSGVSAISRATTSRIPVPKHTPPRQVEMLVPSPSPVPIPGSRSQVPVPFPRGTPGTPRARSPDPARPFPPFSARAPRASMTPTQSSRNLLSASAPRPRMSMGLHPPSSFRTVTPTPTPLRPASRPTSRLSMLSSSGPSGSTPQPFEPSKYDLLDTHVQAIIDEVGWNLFTSRLDPALKRGQRRNDNEEWKGEFVFGAGEKPTGVKLLKLNVRGARGVQEVKWKCLARTGGQWVDLAALLRKRKEQAEGIFSSP